MKRCRTQIAIAVTLLVLAASAAYSLEQVTMDQAERIAANWISFVTYYEGDWGGSGEAYIGEVIEYRPGERLLGYCCHVEPRGYVIVSLYEGLAPVKAYSATCDLDPAAGGSIAEVLKVKIECVYEDIETKAGPMRALSADRLKELVEIDYSGAWTMFDRSPARFRAELETGRILANYQEGDALLTASWHQGHPYNIYCPTPAEVEDDDCDRDHCSVGCVALAAGMLMRYWCWPPFIDWINMPDRIDDASPSHQIHAVASLCSDLGQSVGMKYCDGEGCASGVDTDEMLPVYRALGYNLSCARVDRDDFDTQAGWFGEIRSQIDRNRPVHYRIAGHSLVADGWKVTGGTRWYHLNMGWDGGKPAKDCWDPYEGINTNTWYALDGIPCSQLQWEYILTDIYPFTAVGGAVFGSYPQEAEFRHTYIDVDTWGDLAVFHGNHYIQFIPGVKVTCTGDAGIMFYSASGSPPARLYTKAEVSKGVRIDNGMVLLRRNGAIKLY